MFFAFVIDAFSRTVVGWQLATNMRTTLVLDALRMALWKRGPGADICLVHHSDRGSQYSSIDYTQTLSDRGVLASVGSVGDADDNALAESFVDAFKTELIADRVWRTRSQLELATVEYIGWFNHDRSHQALGDLRPAEFEALHAARTTLPGPSRGDGSVAVTMPRSLETLSAPRISAPAPMPAPNFAEAAPEPPRRAAAVSLRSTSTAPHEVRLR